MYICSVYKELPRYNVSIEIKDHKFWRFKHFYITTTLQNLGTSLDTYIPDMPIDPTWFHHWYIMDKYRKSTSNIQVLEEVLQLCKLSSCPCLVCVCACTFVCCVCVFACVWVHVCVCGCGQISFNSIPM